MSLIIDPGHGGIDGGAAANGLIEETIVLNISLYQYKRFKALGVPVKLTRSSDVGLTPSQRTSIVKNSGMRHCISNHCNAGGGDGAEFIHSAFGSPTMAQYFKEEIEAVGQNVRRIFTRKNSGGSDYYFMHRDTGSVSTVIVEYGFVDSKLDDVAQLKTKQLIYAEAIVKGYCRFAGYKYAAPTSGATKPVATKPKEEVEHMNLSDWQWNELAQAFEYAHKQGLFSSSEWADKAKNKELTDDQVSFLAASLWYRNVKK